MLYFFFDSNPCLFCFRFISQGLVAMDHDDVTVHVVMNGPRAIAGTQKHSMDNFIRAKKRQLQREGAGDKDARPTKAPRT